jgi:hypothetical protein
MNDEAESLGYLPHTALQSLRQNRGRSHKKTGRRF